MNDSEGIEQLRAELKGLQRANQEYRGRLANVTSNREYWYKEIQDAQTELSRVRQDAQDWRDEVQELWLDPAAAEGLRQQLAQTHDDWAHAKIEASKLNAALTDAHATARELRWRLADARRLARLWFRRATMVEVEIAGVEMVRALQAERRLRREAEIELRNSHKTLTEAEQDYSALMRRYGTLEQRAENFHSALLDVHKALDKYQAEASTEDAQTRVAWLGQLVDDAEQRAERAEGRCNNCDAEALAALVTPELAALLERLAGSGQAGRKVMPLDTGRLMMIKSAQMPI